MFSTGVYSDYVVVFASLSVVIWPHYARLRAARLFNRLTRRTAR